MSSNLPPGCSSADGGIDHEYEAAEEKALDMAAAASLDAREIIFAMQVGIEAAKLTREESWSANMKAEEDESESKEEYKVDKTNKEFCICAALKSKSGYIWRGHRHTDCISALFVNGGDTDFKESDCGFMTSKGRFVSREEGLRLQLVAGIPSASGSYRCGKLYSEDLY